MNLSRPQRRPQQDPIVPLIDVVFFLLVFFMLVGRMDASAPFDVAPAVSTAGEDMPSGGITIAVSLDGRLALDGAEMDAPVLLARIAARIEAGDMGADFIRINAHGQARLGGLWPLIAQLEALGVGDVVLVVTPEPA